LAMSQRWAGCDGRDSFAVTSDVAADGQAVWSWHPDAGVKFAGSNFRRRWWLKSPVHQGDHGVTVTPSRRECRFVSGEPVVTTLACFVLLSHARLRVHRASGIPCALTTEGGRNSCKPRACGVARTRRCVLHSRHHPRMRVIQYAAASRLNRRRLWNTGSSGRGRAMTPENVCKRNREPRTTYPSNTASAPFTASALSVTVRSSEVACTEIFSAKNLASVT
jgi:hypothetical protein